ncbi:hypothetical protein S245_005407 [Arachis hypogaea]
MGGIGKTTIAKAVYNKICREFEGRCFLLNIREVWDQDNGGVHLQEQLLSSIYQTMKLKIQNVESGKVILEERLGQKKILFVLDDVDKLEQLNALAANRKWFCPGSVIIITTRDQRLLNWLGVDKVYRLEKLSDRESVELFSWHAFKEPFPIEEFVGFTCKVVSYCGRLPLALEVLGSHLFKRGIQEWISVLEKLKNIPNKQIQKKLKISFDGLNDDEDREIFLDIAFFFIGMDKDEVIDILNGCGYSTEIGISVLRERSLVTIDSKNKLRMHYLLRDMGREIIRENLPLPEERSRLWNPEEVLDVLSKDMGTKAIQGLALKLSRMKPIHLKTNAFRKMKRLRLLQLGGVQLDGDFKYLSTDLRWLSWHGCSSEYTTIGFDQGNLVAIDFKYSNLQLVWKKRQMLMKLEILNLSHSQYLIETPDFSNIPNLKKLILKYCSRLSLFSDTIGDLKKILLVNLKGCTSLRILPRSIYKLKSLKTLILSGCSEINKLEEDLEQMESLTTLMANKTAITQVPNALIRLKSIVYVSLCGFEGLSREVFPSIIWSWTSPTNNLSPQMQTYVNVSCLVSLTVPNNSFHGTSSIIGELPNIQGIRLESGSQIQTTGDFTLDAINIKNCKELEAQSAISHVSNMDTSALVDFHSQGDMSRSKATVSFVLIQMGMKCPVTKILRESISQKLADSTSEVGECLLPGDNNTDWLSFNGEGSSVIFEVPKVKGHNLKAVTLCIVYSSPDIMTYEGLILKNLLIINHTKTTPYLYEGDTLLSLRDEDWQSVISNLEAGDKVQVVVVLGDGIIAKNTAVYLIHDESIDQNIDECQEDVIVNSMVVGKKEDASNVDDMRDKNFSVPAVDATPAISNKISVSSTDKKFKLLDKLNCFNCNRAKL